MSLRLKDFFSEIYFLFSSRLRIWEFGILVGLRDTTGLRAFFKRRHNFWIASDLFPIWVRYFWLVITMQPCESKNFFTSLLFAIIKTWSGYKALESESLKCNLTLVSTLLTFWPPGPPDLLVSKVTSEVMISRLMFSSHKSNHVDFYLRLTNEFINFLNLYQRCCVQNLQRSKSLLV